LTSGTAARAADTFAFGKSLQPYFSIPYVMRSVKGVYQKKMVFDFKKKFNLQSAYFYFDKNQVHTKFRLQMWSLHENSSGKL
jgi:hypothetical protein